MLNNQGCRSIDQQAIRTIRHPQIQELAGFTIIHQHQGICKFYGIGRLGRFDTRMSRKTNDLSDLCDLAINMTTKTEQVFYQT